MIDLDLGNADGFKMVMVPEDLRYRHCYIIGKTGVGKTSLLLDLILQDANEGYAVVVIDTGNLAQQVYETLPEEVLPRVRYFSVDTPFPYNPLVRIRNDVATIETELCSLLDQVVTETSRTIPLTARMQQLISIALHDLFIKERSPTLCGLVEYLKAASYTLCDRMGMGEGLKREFAATHHGVLNRLSQILRYGKMRRILCSGHQLNFNTIIDNGYILIISLAQLSPLLTRMLGAILFQGLQSTIFERPESKAKECAIYVDEFHDYIRSQYSAELFSRIFRQGRRHKVSFTIAHQDFGWVGRELLGSIHGAAAALVAFACGSTEASKMARELGDPARWNEILLRDDYKFRVKVGNEQHTVETYQPLEAIRTIPEPNFEPHDPPNPFDLSPEYPQPEDDNIGVHEPEPTYKDATIERLRKLRERFGGGSNNKQPPNSAKKKAGPRKRV